jgi:hypothetical protein
VGMLTNAAPSKLSRSIRSLIRQSRGRSVSYECMVSSRDAVAAKVKLVAKQSILPLAVHSVWKVLQNVTQIYSTYFLSFSIKMIYGS